MGRFIRDEAAVIAITLDNCEFRVYDCNNREELISYIKGYIKSANTICITTGRFNTFQDMATYKYVIMDMLNMNPPRKPNDLECAWAMDLQLDAEKAYYKNFKLPHTFTELKEEYGL